MKNCKKNTETTEADIGIIKDFKTTTEVSTSRAARMAAGSGKVRVACPKRASLSPVWIRGSGLHLTSTSGICHWPECWCPFIKHDKLEINGPRVYWTEARTTM